MAEDVVSASLADLASLRDTFKKNAGSLATLITDMNNAVNNAKWQGGAATTFRGAWSGYKTKLDSLKQLLDESAVEADKRWKALDAAGN